MNLSIAGEAAANSDSAGLQGRNKKCLKFLEATEFPNSKCIFFPPVVDTTGFTLESK